MTQDAKNVVETLEIPRIRVLKGCKRCSGNLIFKLIKLENDVIRGDLKEEEREDADHEGYKHETPKERLGGGKR